MYQKLIGASSPGLFVILVDQSGSMTERYGNSTRAEFAALAVNRTIYEIIASCRKGEKISDRCHITVIGYGERTELIVGGRPSQIEVPPHGTVSMTRKVSDGAGGLLDIEMKLGVWVQPTAGNGTPMEKAFNLAGDLVEAWTRDNPDNFPPVVINISDGEPQDAAATRAAAQRLGGYCTSDGRVLIYNCHIGTGGTEVKLPHSDNGLPDANARLLYDISSVIPDALLPLVENAGLTAQPGARGMMVNASPEALTKLLVFGSGSMKR